MNYLKSFLTMGCIAAMVWGLSGCKEDEITNEVVLQSINVTPPTVSVVEGATQQLTVTLVPEDVPGVTVSYKSASEAVATVSTSGLVKGVAEGSTTVTVTATAPNGAPVTKAVPVTVVAADAPLTGLAVEPEEVLLTLGSATLTQQLTVAPVPTGLEGVTVSYQSNDEAIATVDDAGLVTAVAEGPATITITGSLQGGTPVSVKVPVTVASALQGITVDPAEVLLSLVDGVGETTQQLTPIIPEDLADEVAITYKSNDEGIATVDDAGLVKAVANGTTTVTVTGTLPGANPVTVDVPVTVAGVDAELNKAAWTAEATSTLGDDVVVTNMFDDDRSTLWHSATSGLPHGFTVDMHGYKRIDGFYYVNRNDIAKVGDRAFPKSMTIETSTNGTDWTEVYTGSNLDQKMLRIVLPLKEPVIARYFKVTITANNNGAGWTYLTEMGAYNEAEPLSIPLNIALTAPVEALGHPVANPLTFSWEADDPVPANYTLKLSKSADLNSATEFTVAETSKEVTAEELSTLLGGDGIATIYWSVSAAGATQPAVRTFTLDGRMFELIEDKLVNAKRPFQTEENVGQWDSGVLRKLTGWTHEGSQISFTTRDDDAKDGFICIWAYPDASLNWADNNKVYQTVHLDAGDYKLVFHLDTKAGGELSAYGVVTTADALPNHDDVTSDANVLGYDHFSDYQSQDRPILFTVPAGGSNVTIGWVYNTWYIGHALVNYRMLGLDLYGLR